jgi:phosphohistidine phosphatase SixA
MYLTCITHAGARDKKAHPFRGLTKKGWAEVESAARHYRTLIDEETPKFDTVVTSPKARCAETALLLAKALSDLCTTSEIQLDPALKAGSVEGDELHALANRVEGEQALVSAHADLVKALPPAIELIPEAAKDGWFSSRPVLVLLEYEPGSPWNRARILACEGLFDGEWRNLLG